MPDGFPLPISSYRELTRVIGAYGKAPENSVPADVGRVIGINESIVSANNGFLKAVGVIQGGRKKTITSAGKTLAAAYEYDRQPEIASTWRSLVEANDFLQKIIAAVRIRKGMDESSLDAHVAYSAGQPKTPRALTGAGTVVEILKVAGVLREDSGNLVAAPESAPSTEIVEQRLVLGESIHQDMSPSNVILSPTTRAPGGVSLSIEVRVQCTPAELDGLGHKLRRVLTDFSQHDEPAAGDTSPAGNRETGPANQTNEESS
jgi:hypothetical protein